MDRTQYVLGVLAASDGAMHSPVQVQKLFFLLDQKIPGCLGGRRFDFVPFDYGPFDSDVYRELETLESEGLVEIDRNPSTGWKSYRATPAGVARGKVILQQFPHNVVKYIGDLSAWVRSLPFASLVSEIYREFPGMRVNSVFQVNR